MNGEPLTQTAVLLVLGLLFLVGLAADLLGRHSPLPRVTLLIVSGVAVGPAGFGLLPAAFIDDWFPLLSGVALALIGFLLGQDVSRAVLSRRGLSVLVVAVTKPLGAALTVAAALLLTGVEPLVALVLAGIATTTAPAATWDVVHESGAGGEFADTLLSVVALDDVTGLLAFALILAFAVTLGTDAGGAAVLTSGLVDIGGSVLLGGALGVPMAYLTGRISRGEPTLAEALGFVLLAAGLAQTLSLTPILTTMTMGSVVAGLARHHTRPFSAIEGIEWPFMILFFVLAGASLDLAAVQAVSAVTLVYVVARTFGTYAGAFGGAAMTGAERSVRNWLGLALLPQAGVAIGMALVASQRLPAIADIVLPTVLTATIVFEIVAPVITRRALRQSRASRH
ncbi:MAG: cation:proton antiporter [Pseudomonadota bacterium]